MNILVTGGAGFIGSHIVDAYLALGHRVIIVDNFSTGKRENINQNATIYDVDLRDERLHEVFDVHKIDVVNHHAAQIDVRASVDNPANDAMVNIVGGINLYEQCVKHGVKKIVFASTGGAIYGEQDYFPADESHPMRPDSPYGISKLANEKYLHYYGKQYGIIPVVLRYTNVYGPRQNPHGEAGVVAIFSEKLCKGEQPVIYGDGLQTRDYVNVADVVRANVAALDVQTADAFNICTGIETTVVEIFEHLRATLRPGTTVTFGPARAGEQRRSVCTYAKIEKALGWTPTVSITEGLKRTAAFFAERSGK